MCNADCLKIYNSRFIYIDKISTLEDSSLENPSLNHTPTEFYAKRKKKNCEKIVFRYYPT